MVNLPNLPVALSRSLSWTNWQMAPAAAAAGASSSTSSSQQAGAEPSPTRREAARDQGPGLRVRRPAPTSLTVGAHHRGADQMERSYVAMARHSYLLEASFAGLTPLVPPTFPLTHAYRPLRQDAEDGGETFVAAPEILCPTQPLTPIHEARARRELANICVCPATSLPLVDPVFDLDLRRSVERSSDSGPSREDVVMREVIQICSDQAHLPLLELWQVLHAALSCPISLDLLQEPCIDTDGHSFSRANLRRALGNSPTCPLSRARLHEGELMEHKTLRALTTWLHDVLFWSSQQDEVCAATR